MKEEALIYTVTLKDEALSRELSRENLTANGCDYLRPVAVS